jgi:tRNA threonylcarbamoyladenosine biosynthesis protein TsaB
MRLLAVDTTTPFGSVALVIDSRLVAETNIEASSTHSARLLRSIDGLLHAAGLEIKDIEGYAVAVGPGSFTGIRIGLSTVKALAFASGKPVAPVSALEALALKLVHPQVRLIAPLIDAKKGEVYAALYEALGPSDRRAMQVSQAPAISSGTTAGTKTTTAPSSSKRVPDSSGSDSSTPSMTLRPPESALRLAEVIAPGAYSPDGFFSRLPSNRVIYFIGNGLSLYKDKLLSYVRDKARFPSRTLFIAHETGLLGYERLVRGEGVEAGNVEPLYYRKSQAEERH